MTVDPFFRFLQATNGTNVTIPPVPNYTSPPLPVALALTPPPFTDDAVMDAARAAAAAGNCTVDGNRCQMVLRPDPSLFSSASKLGVIFYNGALVDPRSYTPFLARVVRRYGMPVVVPIFAADVAFVGCEGALAERLALAAADVPEVEQWILVGHSLGGVAASLDLASAMNDPSLMDQVAGLGLVASYVSQEPCPGIDFSTLDLPATIVLGVNDEIINRTNLENSFQYLNLNQTQVIDILGGNHAGFGAYNDSLRESLLNQTSDEATIPPAVQWDLAAAAIYHVAARTNVVLPTRLPLPTTTSTAASTMSWNGVWLMLFMTWWLARKR